MSDEARIGPMPSAEWLREHRRRVVEETDGAERRQYAASTASVLADVREVARRQVEAFAALPCRGSLDLLADCSDMFALTCERRTSPSCPREIQAFEQTREREELAALFESSAAPQRAARAVLDGFRPTESTMVVDEFLADKEASLLVLAGSVGVGKTVAAVYAIRRRRGFCRFIGAGRLVDTSRFDPEAQQERRLAYDCGLLVVDDLGTEYGDAKGWFQSVLDPLLVDRHERRRQTIITCNLDAETFRARYGERLFDRILGNGMFREIAGPSLRRRTP